MIAAGTSVGLSDHKALQQNIYNCAQMYPELMSAQLKAPSQYQKRFAFALWFLTGWIECIHSYSMVLWFLFLAILVVTTERGILQFNGHYIKQLLYHISDIYQNIYNLLSRTTFQKSFRQLPKKKQKQDATQPCFTLLHSPFFTHRPK